MNKNNALIIFLKNPELGKVKTRLKPELSEKNCVAIYRAMVNDLVENVGSNKQYDTIILFTPANSEKNLKQWLGPDFTFVPQSDGDLGKRMDSALHWAFEHKYQQAVLIGSDTPTINQKLILTAFQKLENSDVVLGPSKDGGYYLIATKETQPNIFKNIQWSSNTVFDETMKSIEENNLSVISLEQRADIDTFSDLLELWQYLNAGHNDLSQDLPEIFKILTEILQRLPVNYSNTREIKNKGNSQTFV